MPEFTTNKKLILSFIRGFFVEHQSMPTFKDIAFFMDYKSPNAVQGHIDGLKKLGFLENVNGRACSYKLANVKITIEDLPSE